MIINFSVKNWMSFKDISTFSMVASRERQHMKRVTRLKKYNTRILPVAALYGGNASGKSNFFKALRFMKKMVVKGTKPEGLIVVEPFLLDPNSIEKPSYFKIEILIDKSIFEYSFSLTKKKIIDEKLVMINSISEKILYTRKNDEIEFHNSLKKDERLKFVFEGTRENQLFLTNSISQKVNNFMPVYKWFKENLELISPDSMFVPFYKLLNERYSLHSDLNNILSQLDTGVVHLGDKEISLDSLNFPNPVKTFLMENVEEGTTVTSLSDPSTNERLIFKRKNDELTVKKMVAYHLNMNGEEILFEMKQESDGTLRLIDLLPSFIEMSSTDSKKVFIIDEVDRSIHTLLIRKLLELYLNNCSLNSRTQLIVTTHDALLMDQKLFRRDEIWVMEKNDEGSTEFTPFSEFKDIRNDKDIRKSYLQGRMGGIPKILLNEIKYYTKE